MKLHYAVYDISIINELELRWKCCYLQVTITTMWLFIAEVFEVESSDLKFDSLQRIKNSLQRFTKNK
jgi:hypothetical protein